MFCFFPVEKSIHNVRWAAEWLLVGTKRREFCMLAAKPRVQAHWQRGPDCWHQFINQTGSVPVWRARLDFPQVPDQQTPQGKRIRLFNLFVHFQKESWISWFNRVHGDQYMATSKPAANQTVGSLADGGGRTHNCETGTCQQIPNVNISKGSIMNVEKCKCLCAMNISRSSWETVHKMISYL